MPRTKPNRDFKIHVDSSYLNTPMDQDIPSLSGNVEKTSEAPRQSPDTTDSSDGEVDPSSSTSTEHSDNKSDTEMTQDTEKKAAPRGLRPSVEDDDDDDSSTHDEEAGEHSMLSERTDLSFQPEDRGHSYVDHSESEADATPRGRDEDESSSQQGGTDEDVFTDKSPRSSMGSYDAGSESGKGVDIDNMTTITRSPRISDISQYDKEDFIPTARGTPRPPFRTPSDVRAMQMSSPAGSVVGSPRSSKKHFPSVSRLGTPSASAQYSPKRKSTPPRFKSRQEAPLVLLHVTLLPLRWMWGDLVNNLDPVEMSEQAKTLRNSWRILQDRVGDTVIERGILLGHPQNDYEVLEERLLEALDLPVRRRARILECGHYLGPSNEATIAEEESEDEYGKQQQQQQQSSFKRHWCSTCKSEIRYEALGGDKIFRVKVYASNGLMRAGAWEACWKEMERVDVELEPVVEPAVQDEIVRLAAAQQEREEAEIAKEVEMQYEEQRRSETRQSRQHTHANIRSSPLASPEPEVMPEAARQPRYESRASRRRQRDERLHEIYGQSPPQSPLPPESPAREPSQHPDPYAHSPPSPPPPAPEPQAEKQKETRRGGYQSASLPELLWRTVRVLMQDRKNVVIVALSLFVLLLSLRSTPPEPSYEPIVHRLKNMPEIQRFPTVSDPPVRQEYQRPMEAIVRSEPSYSSVVYHPVSQSQSSESSVPNAEYQEEESIVEPSVTSLSPEPASESTQDSFTSTTSVSTIYGPCESPIESSPEQPAVSDIPTVQETVEEIETVTEKKVVKVIHTVTEIQTETETQTEIQTEAESTTLAETATSVEEYLVEAIETAQAETAIPVEESLAEAIEITQTETAIPVEESMVEATAQAETTTPVEESLVEAIETAQTETAIPVEESVVEVTKTAQAEIELDLEDATQEPQDDARFPSETAMPSSEVTENEEPVPEAMEESITESEEDSDEL